MPFPVSIIGRSTAPVTHEVDDEWLTGFAHAVGGFGAHPLFPVCVEWPAVVAAARLDDGALRADERRRGVHASHDLAITRVLRPGDVVTTTATVEALEPRPNGTLERLRIDTRDARGLPVATTIMGSMFLGVTVDDAAKVPDAPPSTTDRLAEISDPPEATIAVAVSADQARAYSQASHIWNPIHTDSAAAVAAGLPRPILHGTCTLALATSAALAWAGVDRADPVRRIRARFSGLVAMPSMLELRVWRPSGNEVRFAVVDSAHAPVIRAGQLTLDSSV